MATARSGELKRFVSEALELWFAERNQNVGPADPLSERPPWPNIGQVVMKKQPPPEKSQKQLVWRLKRFRYPYVARHPYQDQGGNRRNKTFYRHVKDLGLLDFLVNPPFLFKVRLAWYFRDDYEIEKQLREEAKGPYGYPRAYHREMMHAIVGVLGQISRIAAKYPVPWSYVADYYRQSLRQLLRDAAVCYPRL